MSVQSQDVYAAPGVTLSVVGAGGGALPANAEVSTISALGLLNVSSINGSAYIPGAVPENPAFQSISTLTINLLSSINGVPYVAGGVPANLTVSSISSLALNSVSSINGAPYVAGGIPANLTVSSISTLALNNVSTINGAAGARSLGTFGFTIPPFSTQYNPDNFNPIGTAYTIPNTLAGHYYRLDLPIEISPIQPSVDPASVPADAAFAIFVGGGGTSIFADSIPVRDIYNLSRNQNSTFDATYSVPFLGIGGTMTVYGAYRVNNASTFYFNNSTLVSSLGAAILTDLGVL